MDSRGTAAHHASAGVALGDLSTGKRLRGQSEVKPECGSLALGGSGRRDVGHDAGLRNVLVPGFAQMWVRLQVEPAPVDQSQTRSHHNQDFVAVPERPQAHDGAAGKQESRFQAAAVITTPAVQTRADNGSLIK